MKLSTLLARTVKDDFVVQGMKEDSRHVEAGDIFVFDKRIIEGGEKFVTMAREKGAKAIVTNLDIQGDDVYKVENPFDVLGAWAKHVYPKAPKVITGVTGTNGKTSVAWFYNCILSGAGLKVGSIGTLGVYCGKELLAETGFTSPTPVVLHKYLHELAEKGVEYLCMEVSSHALDLHRCDSVDFKAAGFTNLSPDHRDYHGTMEAYMAAKARLFTECLPESGSAVLNILQPVTWPLAALCKDREVDLLTVGVGQAELVVKQQEVTSQGMVVDIKFEDKTIQTTLPLIGAFQAENVAVAIGLALKSGLTWEQIEKGLSNLSSVPGRMEMIVQEGKPVVVVDYAHTPDALKTAIEAVRPQVEGKLWTLFGCGGDRDKTKRPEMGKIACTLSDEVIVTDDNPRTENAEIIRKEVLSACKSAIECGDREEAIKLAIQKAGVNDTILLAGKGHESGQYVNGEVIPFDDRDQARKLLNAE